MNGGSVQIVNIGMAAGVGMTEKAHYPNRVPKRIVLVAVEGVCETPSEDAGHADG